MFKRSEHMRERLGLALTQHLMQSRVRSNSHPSPDTTTFLLPTLAEQRCLSVSIENLTIAVNRTILKSYSGRRFIPRLTPFLATHSEKSKAHDRHRPCVRRRFVSASRALRFSSASPTTRDSTALKRSYAGLGLELQGKKRKAPNRTKACET